MKELMDLNQAYAEFFTLMDERMTLERDGVNDKGEKVEYRTLVDRVNQLSPAIEYKRNEVKELRISLRKKYLEFFHSALCNAGSIWRGYGLQLDYSALDYELARLEYFVRHGEKSGPCFEDLLIIMLEMGKELKVHDIENDGEYDRTITLNDVYANMPKVPMSDLMDMANEQDDSGTGDVILQTIFFGEVVFG